VEAAGVAEAEERQEGADAITEPRRPSKKVRVAFLAAALALVVVPLGVSRLVGQPAGTVYRFDIPEGTAARIAAGETVDVLPADLRFTLADRLVVVNHDREAHRLGPFTIAPGARLDRRLSDAGTYTGFCTLHADSRIGIEVAARS
jgi:hypothetical protein